ncbi:MAG: (2Fe-2S)-binding protein [Gammaproteobacteria bacterium]|nr:(2Fe-2S)-binding protein [Gammaproteobacteria bacterium]
MYICVCNAVTDRDIREAAGRGICSMEALGDQLKVATCCGRCLDHANKVLMQALTDGSGNPRLSV